jgi:ribosome-binding factor A
MSGRRQERVAAQIQHTIAEAVATKVKDSRVGFVTVTGVILSPDLSHATVRVSVMGSDEDKENTLSSLESMRGFLRSLLARSLSLRSTPELHFELDRGLEHAARIEQLLARIKKDEQAT